MNDEPKKLSLIDDYERGIELVAEMDKKEIPLCEDFPFYFPGENSSSDDPLIIRLRHVLPADFEGLMDKHTSTETAYDDSGQEKKVEKLDNVGFIKELLERSFVKFTGLTIKKMRNFMIVPHPREMDNEEYESTLESIQFIASKSNILAQFLVKKISNPKGYQKGNLELELKN